MAERYSYIISGMLCLFMFALAEPAMAVLQDMQQRMITAQKLEQSGNLNEAKILYEDLYRENPDNLVIFNRLKDLCIKTGDYQQAEALVETRLMKMPQDPGLTAFLGQIVMKMGDEDKAKKIWKDILERYPKQTAVYQTVASAMISERLFDEAIEVYREGREKIGKKDLFTFNITNLYEVRMDYSSATHEYLEYLRLHPEQSSVIETQMQRFPATERVLADVEKQVKKALEETDQPSLRRILSGVYLRAGRFQEAYHEITVLASAEKEGGDEYLRFGQQAINQGAPEHAEIAYRDYLKLYPQSAKKEEVWYSLAGCLHAQKRYREATVALAEVERSNPKSNLAPQALLEMGVMQRDELFYLSAAESTFVTIISKYPKSIERAEARLELGTCALLYGDTERAEKSFVDAAGDGKEGGKIWIRALYRLAEVHFFLGRLDSAGRYLDRLLYSGYDADAVHDIEFNNALDLRLLIDSYGADPEPVHRYARSMFLQKQRNMDLALAVMDTLLVRWPDHGLIPETLYRMGLIEMERQNWEEAISFFRRITERYAGSLFGDLALERTAWTYEQLKKPDRAMKYYEDLLLNYPQSFVADEVRSRIRRLEKMK